MNGGVYYLKKSHPKFPKKKFIENDIILPLIKRNMLYGFNAIKNFWI